MIVKLRKTKKLTKRKKERERKKFIQAKLASKVQFVGLNEQAINCTKQPETESKERRKEGRKEKKEQRKQLQKALKLRTDY